jgi:hypothetical protein
MLVFVLLGLLILFKIVKIVFRFFVAIILNSVIGVALFFLLSLVGITIPTWPYILPVAMFGIPALLTILILRYLGVPVF